MASSIEKHVAEKQMWRQLEILYMENGWDWGVCCRVPTGHLLWFFYVFLINSSEPFPLKRRNDEGCHVWQGPVQNREKPSNGVLSRNLQRTPMLHELVSLSSYPAVRKNTLRYLHVPLSRPRPARAADSPERFLSSRLVFPLWDHRKVVLSFNRRRRAAPGYPLA